MFLVWSIHNLYFLHLFEEPEVDYGEHFTETGDLALTDLPYNIRRVFEDQAFDHDNFSVDNLKSMVSLCRKVMKFSSHGLMPFPLWSLHLGTSCC